MKSVDNWYKICEEIDELMYGENGIVTTAFADPDLENFRLDTDKVINILKEIKEIEKVQGKLNNKQIEKLKHIKLNFLEIENGKNGIKQMYNQIKIIYENIEEY